MLINTDTKIFGSFSINPGNNGCKYFNSEFKKLKVNAIYKSFKVVDLEKAVNAAITFGFSGFGVSMPHKTDILNFCTQISEEVKIIQACNTVVIDNGKLTGYNTDWLGVRDYFKDIDVEGLSIIGTGGFSRAVQYFCTNHNIPFEVFSRENISSLSTSKYPSFNATPADIKCDFDGRPHTKVGKRIAALQAKYQLQLYLHNE